MAVKEGIRGYAANEILAARWRAGRKESLACLLNHVTYFALGTNIKIIINMLVLLHFYFSKPQ
jgi:hypothetical protein